MEINEVPETIDRAIRAYRDALDRQARRDVDAASCNTRHDWKRAREATDAALEAEDALRAAIRAELERLAR